MLALFPGILFLAPLGTAILRVVAGLAFCYLAYRMATLRGEVERENLPLLGHAPEWSTFLYALVIFAAGVLLIIGLYTQAAAIVGMLIAFEHGTLAHRYRKIVPLSRAANVLLFFICLSLLLSGAGAFAFDLPL